MAPSRDKRRGARRAVALLLSTLLAAAPGGGTARAEDAAGAIWTAGASEGVESSIERQPEGGPGTARLAFAFHGGAGFASVSRTLPLEFPAHFEVTVAVRSSAGSNAIELKFIDASGENVWWYRPTPGRVAAEWQTLRIRQRQIEFAWGPTAERRLARTTRVELVVHAGHGVSRGTLDVGAISVTPVAAPPDVWPAPRIVGDGPAVPSALRAAPDGREANVWHCARGQAPCALALDFGLPREFGGMRLIWDAREAPSTYSLELSDDGATWRTARRVEHGTQAIDWLWFGESEARFVRIALDGPRSRGAKLKDAGLLDITVGTNINEFITTLAKAGRRGGLPRGFTEQSYWTLVGFDGGTESALLGEDGAVELGRGGPSLEPFVVENGRVLTWADVDTEQRLADGYLPIPTAEWRSAHFALAVNAVGHRSAAGEGLWARYHLSNRTKRPLHLRLALAARPFQVNPPAQFLTTPGGVSPIAQAAWDERELVLDRKWRIVPLTAPSAARLYRFDSQAIPDGLAREFGHAPATLDDETRLATAVLAYDVDLPPSGGADVGVFVPWVGTGPEPSGAAQPAASDLRHAFDAETRFWRQRLNRTTVRALGSVEAREVTDSLRTALAHILLSRAGPMLRPGTRAYARSWIRDGAMMSDALLRLGENDVPREYLRAYAPNLFANGKVPCCMDERGADPVPENDSPGEFIHLAAAVFKATGDEALLQSVWPRIRAAGDYLGQLREDERSRAGGAGDAAFAGLLPPSISHEGYSAKPMHSYWDDFWGLRGLSDAVYIATRLHHPTEAAAFESLRLEFARDVLASIDVVTRTRHLDFIPGAADLGDFDATSTTIALSPGVGPVALPLPLLESTFERYWRWFVTRRDGTLDWHDYTPYEWRVVGSLVRLGRPERAHAALQYFLDGRRPTGWRQWPEVIDRDARHARFIGDLPHGWVASDFIRATLDLFAFERESDDAVVLAAGLPAAWLAAPGVEVRGLLTRAGAVNYRLVRHGRRTELRLLAGSAVPPGGFVYREPAGSTGARVLLDGRPAQFTGGELQIRRVPAAITLLTP